MNLFFGLSCKSKNKVFYWFSPNTQKVNAMNKWSDLMIDIETLGKETDAVIAQIAAVPFDITTGNYDKNNLFCQKVSIKSNLDFGRKVDESTLLWWFSQPREVQKSVIGQSGDKDTVPLNAALVALRAFTQTHCVRIPNVWSHATFDYVILQHASCTSCKLGRLFDYRSAKDIRTLNGLYSYLTGRKRPEGTSSFKGLKHNALDDCLNQIKYCSAMYKEIGSSRTEPTKES